MDFFHCCQSLNFSNVCLQLSLHIPEKTLGSLRKKGNSSKLVASPFYGVEHVFYAEIIAYKLSTHCLVRGAIM